MNFLTRRVEVLALPRDRGNFGRHLVSVKSSLLSSVQQAAWFPVQFVDYRADSEEFLLLLFQPQGRVGDEFLAALPQELRDGSVSRQILPVIVQDSSTDHCDRAFLPKCGQWLPPISVHVIPGQSRLCRTSDSNKAAVTAITRRLQNLQDNGRAWIVATVSFFLQKLWYRFTWIAGTALQCLAAVFFCLQAPIIWMTTRLFRLIFSSIAWIGLSLFSPADLKLSYKVPILLLPRAEGSFKEHLEKLKASLQAEINGANWHYPVYLWEADRDTPGELLLILFQPQGRPGDEFNASLPDSVSQYSRIVTILVQDSETGTDSPSLLPPGDRWEPLVDVHVVPGTSHLRRSSKNRQAVLSLVDVITRLADHPVLSLGNILSDLLFVASQLRRIASQILRRMSHS